MLTKGVVDKLVDHALREAPKEACGVLGGVENRVTDVWACRNVSSFPETCYEIAPEDLLRALEEIKAKGLEVLGFYHSHPVGLSRPSGIDEKRATWPGYSYVIVSLSKPPAITSWKWIDGEGRFVKEKVKWEERI